VRSDLLRSPITVHQAIAALPDEVWAVISAPGYLEECHPFCAANPVRVWPGTGSHDTIEYHNGRVVDRMFTMWLEGAGYDLEVTDVNGPLATVSWRIGAAGQGATLTIGLTPRFLRGVPAAVRWAPNLMFVRPMMRWYLRSVVRGVEWRVTTGRPVGRNQFGSHPWFSPRA
jgi:hypothetical protein